LCVRVCAFFCSPTTTKSTTAEQESTVEISAAKAKELGVQVGDVVVLVGRRRHAAYATVGVSKSKRANKQQSSATKTAPATCSIPSNLASNLRLRQGDKVKVVKLSVDSSSSDDASGSKLDGHSDNERSGDLLLIEKEPGRIASVTLSPVEDSINSLIQMEGGDSIPDEEVVARFVTPYVERGTGLLKLGHLLSLRDENGRQLEFYVTHVGIEGGSAEEEEENDEEEAGKRIRTAWRSRPVFGVCCCCLAHCLVSSALFSKNMVR
jgi:hypothetical protein